MKYSLIITSAFALFLGVMEPTSCYAVDLFKSSVLESDYIPTAVVRRGEFEKTIKSVGELKAANSAVLASPFNGKVVRLLPEGTKVEAKQTVVWLDTESLVQDLRDQEAELLLAQKDLEAAEEDYRLQDIQNGYNMKSELGRVELAEQKKLDTDREYETEKTLVEKKISPRSRLDDAELSRLQSAVELRNARINLAKTEENLASNLRVKQTSIDKAQMAVESIEREIDDTKDKIDKAELRAPTAGEVSYFLIYKSGTRAKVAEGDSVWPRLNLVEIPDRTQMLAIVPVNELDISNVKADQPVDVFLDALPGKSYAGSVVRKSIVPIDNSRRGRSSSNGGGPREFEVRIEMTESNESFFQGMTASVRIQVNLIKDTLIVPVEALLKEDALVGVYTKSPGEKFVPVKVLDFNELEIAIQGDLKIGDVVYLRHPKVSLEEARSMGQAALATLSGTKRNKKEKKPGGAPQGKRPGQGRPK
jgi:HlyD family secretion protein